MALEYSHGVIKGLENIFFLLLYYHSGLLILAELSQLVGLGNEI